MKRVLIIGSQGQDGQILFDQVAALGCAILGIGKKIVRAHLFESPISAVDILDPAQARDIAKTFAPDEIYYLAAFHHAAEDRALRDSATLYHASHAIHVAGLLNFLEAIRLEAPRARLFYAASSHVFGNAVEPIQDESTPFRPEGVYAITKIAGIHCCRLYRQSHNVHAAVGFLYNHESPLRRPEFLSQKIVRGALAVFRGAQPKLVLGNLSAIVDWGYAPDYTNAMSRILELDEPDDFIIATGKASTVRDFATAAFSRLNLDPAGLLGEDPSIIVKGRSHLVGNAARLRARTGWAPSITFEQMVHRLVEHEAVRQGIAI